MLNRRQFLASVAAGLTGLVTWRYLASTGEGAIVDIVRKRLYYLKLDPNGVNAFARDLVKRKIISGGKLRAIDTAGPVYTLLSSHIGDNALAHNFKHGEERIASMYLLSTDFFRNGHDKSKIVRYVEFYAPFEKFNPCQTLFARPVKYNAS
jgi:hypothetical protein